MTERRLERRGLAQTVEEWPDPVGQPAQDRVREGDSPFELRAPDELDRLVDGGIAGNAVEVSELERTEPERRSHRGVELANGSPPDRLDRMVERPYPLDGAVRELPGERPVAIVETGRRRAERAVGVGVLLEDALQHLERGRARGADRGSTAGAHGSPGGSGPRIQSLVGAGS